MCKILENISIKYKKKMYLEYNKQYHETKDNDFLESICYFLHDVPFFFFQACIHCLVLLFSQLFVPYIPLLLVHFFFNLSQNSLHY